jgi:hypothetical protein
MNVTHGLFILFCLILRGQSPDAIEPPTLQLPPRSATARDASVLIGQWQSLSAVNRDSAAVSQVSQGNIPDYLRTLVPITVEQSISGQTRRGTFFVTPDYLTVGSANDAFRVPLGAQGAQAAADAARCILPTRKMVNAIYEAAPAKIAPTFFNPNDVQINTLPIMAAHHENIETQLDELSHFIPGTLLGGHKKDVVITPQIGQRPPPPRVAIYGWHQLNGQPIQPLSLVHVDFYSDYSHGIRLVHESMLLDDEWTSVATILTSPTLAPLLSDEGVVNPPHYPRD